MHNLPGAMAWGQPGAVNPSSMQTMKVSAVSASMADTIPEMAQPAPPPAPVPAAIATTTVEQTGTALVFRAGRSVNIPSDNSPHKTTIARDNLPCSFDYVCAPVLEENVHLRAVYFQHDRPRLVERGCQHLPQWRVRWNDEAQNDHPNGRVQDLPRH